MTGWPIWTFRCSRCSTAPAPVRTPSTLRSLQSHQAIWRDWRNTCGADPDCLARRYIDRILDFDPSRAATLLPGDPDAPVERRLREGRYETVWPDGSITYVNASGGGGGTISADGEAGSSYSFIQVLPDDFPTLPGAANPWVEQVELGLIDVVKSLLPPENHADYDALHTGLPLDARIFRHIDAIGFLSDD